MKQTRTTQNGAAAVEFALVALLLCGLLFGMIDAASWIQANRTMRDGTRAASRSVAQACFGGGSTCVGGNSTTSDERARKALRAVSGSATTVVTKLVIYKASAASANPPAECVTGTTSVANVCNITMNPFASGATLDMSGWTPTSRNRTVGSGEYVGVYVETAHVSPIGLVFKKTITIKTSATFLLEPSLIAASNSQPLPILAFDPPLPINLCDTFAPCDFESSGGGGGGGTGGGPPPFVAGNGAG